MRKTGILLAIAFLGSGSFVALAVESPNQDSAKQYAPGQMKDQGESAKEYAPGQMKDQGESAKEYAPGQMKDSDTDKANADESAKMGKDAGNKSGDNAKLSGSDTDKINQPDRKPGKLKHIIHRRKRNQMRYS